LTQESFLESCEKASHNGREINTTVFERLTAMDDFVTFKKIMTKRNTELQLEAMRQFTLSVNTPYPTSSSKKFILPDVGNEREDGKMTSALDDEEKETATRLLDPDEILAMKEAELAELQELDNLQEEEVGRCVFVPAHVSLTASPLVRCKSC
jgi:hypothetical protein